MRVLQLNFYGDHNLGLFAKASDKACIVGNFIPDRALKRIRQALRIKPISVIRATVANTDFIGMLCCMNSNGIILPSIATDKEVNGFKLIAKKFGMNLEILKSKFTALGNLVLCNDNGAAVSRLFRRRERKAIEDCLAVEADYCSVAGMDVIGSCGIATNKGCLLHRDASEQEIERIESLLKVEADIGTANFGSPFVGACGFANSRAAIVGESTTGPEINRLMGALGFL